MGFSFLDLKKHLPAKEKGEEKLPLFFFDLGRIAYRDFLEFQEEALSWKKEGGGCDLVFFAEHEPVYTAGVQVREVAEKIKGVPVYRVKRGGQLTYHGPGIQMVYFLVSLKARKIRMREFIETVLRSGQKTFSFFGLSCEVRLSHPGIWVQDRKIASAGFGVFHFVTFHGLAFHLFPDLSFFFSISPCGLSPQAMTSWEKETGKALSFSAFQQVLKKYLAEALEVVPEGAFSNFLKSSRMEA